MSDQVPCCLCGTPTKNFGVEAYNACPPCSEVIYTIRIGRGSTFPDKPAGFRADDPKWTEAFLKAQAQLGKTTATEGNCKQCGKANDVGVKSCWWCTCPNPV